MRTKVRGDGHKVADDDVRSGHLPQLADVCLPDEQRLGLCHRHGSTPLGTDAVHLRARVVPGHRGHAPPADVAVVVCGRDEDVVRQVQQLHAALLEVPHFLGALGEVAVDPVADHGIPGCSVFNEDDRSVPGHRLDGRVDEPLAPRHGVHEKLLRLEPLHEGRLHEATGVAAVVVPAEVRQDAPLERQRNAPALDVLLSEPPHHLAHVHFLAFGAGVDHGQQSAPPLLRVLDRGLADGVEKHRGDVAHRERLHEVGVADERVRRELARVQRVQHVDDLLASLCREALYFTSQPVLADQVADADGKPRRDQPVARQVLRVVQDAHRARGPVVVVDRVQDARAGSLVRLLVQLARLELAELDHLALGVHVQRLRQQRRQKLLARPRLGARVARARAHVREQVAGRLSADGNRVVRDQVHPERDVLHDADDGLVAAGSDDLRSHPAQHAEFRGGHGALRAVRIHLVSVEIGVVWRSHHHGEPESVERHDPDAVRHHAHPVERRLSVEEHDVAVQEVAVDDVAELQLHAAARLDALQLDERAARRDLDVDGAGVLRRPVLDRELQPLDVVGAHDLRHAERLGDAERHAELLDRDVWVGRDDGTGALVDALAAQVASDAALLALQARRDGPQRAVGGLDLGDARASGGAVVDVGDDVDLQVDDERRERLRVGARRHARLQQVVALDDLDELDGQVVVAALSGAVLRGRANRDGRDGKHRDEHGIGTMDAGHGGVGGGHVPQDGVDLIGRQVDRLGGRLALRLPRQDHGRRRVLVPSDVVGAACAAGGARLDARLGARRLDGLEALGVGDLLAREPLNVRVVGLEHERRAPSADAAEELLDELAGLDVEDGGRELDVAVVADALRVGVHARVAPGSVVVGAHPGVVQPPWHGRHAVEELGGRDLAGAHGADLLRRHHGKLDLADLLDVFGLHGAEDGRHGCYQSGADLIRQLTCTADADL